jgi:hypothetical protein
MNERRVLLHSKQAREGAKSYISLERKEIDCQRLGRNDFIIATVDGDAKRILTVDPQIAPWCLYETCDLPAHQNGRGSILIECGSEMARSIF